MVGFKEFYVFGAKGTGGTNDVVFTPEATLVLDHQKVTGGKGNWAYEPHASWVANKTFRFAAYANGNADGGESNKAKLTEEQVSFIENEAVYKKDSNGNTIISEGNPIVDHYVWGLDITNYEVGTKDLVAAVPEQKVVGDITTAPGSVGLTFKHILSKVIFQFYATNSDSNLKMEIQEFSFSAPKKGDCIVRYTGVNNNTVIGADWKNTSQNGDYTFFEDYDWSSSSWTSGSINDALYVIPQSNEGKTVANITVLTKNTTTNEVLSTRTYTNIPLTITDHTEWLPGYVYRYQADLTPEQHYIHFTTSVTAWIDEDDRNQTITGGTVTDE